MGCAYIKEMGQFYSDNSINPFTTTIVVSGNIGGVNRRMFTGIVLNIRESVNQQQVSIVCIQDTRRLREIQVSNFGVEKYNVQVTPLQESILGTYSIPQGLTPTSDDSLKASTEGRALDVSVDNSLRVFGVFDRNNVKQTEDSVITEGGFLDTPPIIEVKSPHRYKELESYLAEFLAHEEVSNRKS